MSLILNIDTALSTASVCLSKDGKVLSYLENPNQKDHSTWLHTAILNILAEGRINTGNLTAIAVNTGPGSYTGLRVGLSAAKGLCYALGIPLISINSLMLLALAVSQEAEDLICTAIDARRMEAYVAVYQKDLKEITPPSSVIINENSFGTVLHQHKILFCGNGSSKMKGVIKHPNALFSDATAGVKHLAHLSYQQFIKKEISDLVNTEPLYIKEPLV